MPAIDVVVLHDSLSGAKRQSVDSVQKKTTCERQFDKPVPSVSTDLLDLDDLFSSTGKPISPGVIVTDDVDDTRVDDVDLLSDIFTGTAPIAPPEKHNDESVISQTTPPQEVEAHITSTTQTRSTNAHLKVFEKDGLTITMDLAKDRIDPMAMDIKCNFLNYTHKDFEQLVFQAAVPKYVSMEWKPASANIIPANNLGAVTQTIKVRKIISSKPLMMRLKIKYTVGGRKIVEQAQVSSFPIQ
jgi:AP-1 complex subunit gamma-1